jgi:hypothetical protein
MAPDTDTPRRRTTRASRDRRWAGPGQPKTAEAISHQRIDAARFNQSLLHMSRPKIELQAAGLRTRGASPGDDVAWWEATMALDEILRRRGASHGAAMAAHLASQAVLVAATRTGLALGPDVIAVARSAGEVARVLAAGDLNTSGASYLARGWEDLLISAAESDSPPGPADGQHHRQPLAAANEPRRGRCT